MWYKAQSKEIITAKQNALSAFYVCGHVRLFRLCKEAREGKRQVESQRERERERERDTKKIGRGRERYK